MKGSRVGQFQVGEHITYQTNVDGVMLKDTGRICKLHKSGRQGVAEIYPDGHGKKLSRKLQHVFKRRT